MSEEINLSKKSIEDVLSGKRPAGAGLLGMFIASIKKQGKEQQYLPPKPKSFWQRIFKRK